MHYATKITKRITAFLLALLILVGVLPLSVSAAEIGKESPVKTSEPVSASGQTEYLNNLNGWKVKSSWSNLSDPYEWNAENDSSRQPKMMITYRINTSNRHYSAGDISFKVPGIGNSNRASIKPATSVAGGEDNSEWNYTYDVSNDIYTFKNRYEIQEGQSTNGGFELVWTLNARETVNEYSQSKSVVFSDGEGEITLPPLSFSFTSKRDTETVTLTRSTLSGQEYEEYDKSKTWYIISNDFTERMYARGLYKSRYFVTLDIPEGTTIDDIDIYLNSPNSSTGQLISPIDLGEGKYGFYVFNDRYNSLRYAFYPIYLAFDTSKFENKVLNYSGHLECLFNDEEDWTTTPLDEETYDVNTSFTVVSYSFPKANGVLSAKKGTHGYSQNPYASRLNSKEIFNNVEVQFSLTGTIDVDYGQPIFATAQSNKLNKVNSESVGDGGIIVRDNTKGDLVLGDNKLSAVLKNGDIRELTDDEYNFSCITLPALSGKSYQLYTATTQDELYENYTLHSSGTLNRNVTINFTDKTVKALYVKVFDVAGPLNYSPTVTVSLHLDSEAELSKPSDAQVEPEKYISNFMFMRFFIESGGTQKDMAAFDRYDGTFAQRLRAIDLNTFGNVTYRASSEVWLKTSATYVSSDTILRDFTNAERRGYSSSVKSSGQIKSDDAETLKKFTMVTAFPSQLTINNDEDVIISGNVNAPHDLSSYVNIRSVEKGGKRYMIAEFDFTSYPLNSAEEIKFNIEYPISLSYYDYLEYGNYYRADTFVLIKDEGVEYLKLSSNHLAYDTEDFDNDGNAEEKGALFSVGKSIMEEAHEWREFTSKDVKSYYSEKYAKEAVTRKYNASQSDLAELSAYTYRLDFGVGADNAKNIIFYDDLETGAILSDADKTVTIPTEWQGSFVGVDTSYAEKMGLIPTVYYTTVSNAAKDVTSSVWSTTAPGNMANVKGVAVALNTDNLTNGALCSGQSTYVEVNMLAPSDGSLSGKKAVNQFFVTYDAYGTEGTYEQSYELPSAETYVKFMNSVGRKILRKVDIDAPVEKADGSTSYQKITGAKIKIYDSSRNLLVDAPESFTNTGEYLLKDIENGLYYWEEAESPQGYKKAFGLHPFVVSDNGNTVETVGNERIRGSVSFHKRDYNSGQEYIPNAVYSLYTKSGDLVYTNSNNEYSESEEATVSEFLSKSDNNKVTITNLPWGDYYIQEKVPPKGYELSDTKYEFTISKEIQTVDIVLEDHEVKTTARLIKHDSETGQVLKNARYYLEKYHQDTQEWQNVYNGTMLKTNSVGEILAENLLFGIYRWREFFAPTGYEICEPIEFEITPENAGTIITCDQNDPRKTGTAKIRKKSTDGLMLKGAVFSVYNGNDELIKDGLFTNEFGETPEVSNLAWGNYYFKEDKAPNGYLLNPEKFYFTVDATTSEITQVIDVTDEKQLGSVKLIKTNKYTNDSDKILLEGAIFDLYLNDGTLIRKDLTTNQDGEINISGLDWGSYYFSETKAPDGYSANSDKIRFSINASNAATTQEVSCMNEQGLCEIKVDKVINEQYEAFGGATFIFQVVGTDNEGKQHIYTKALTIPSGQNSGSIVFSGIPHGTYQVREKEISRYKQGSITAKSRNVIKQSITFDGVSKQIAIIDLTSETFGEVEFKNNMTQYEKLNHNDTVVNILSKSRKLIGITVDYVGKNPISSKTSSVYTFTDSDVVVTAYYDNDTSQKVDFSDVVLSPATVTAYENSTGVGYTVDVSYTENGITCSDSFNVQLELKPLPPRTRVLFDANEGYFLHNSSSLLDVSVYKKDSVSNHVIMGSYEEPENDTKMFLGWYTTPDCQEDTKITVLTLDSNNPENSEIVFIDSQDNPIQFDTDTTLYAKWSEPGTLSKSGSCGNNATYSLYDNGLLIIEGSGALNDYTFAYAYTSSIKKVIIKDGITSIGRSAFLFCEGLTSITIPDSVTSISDSAFQYCRGLTNISIPDSVVSIGDSAFNGCSGLTSITIPNSVTAISANVFDSCTGLTNIFVSSENSKYDSRNNCNAIIETSTNTLIFGFKNTVIPDSVTSIGDSAFLNCSGLTSITIPDSVTSISNSAFSGCTGLTNILVSSENPKYDSRNNCNAIIETSTNTLEFGCKNTVIPDSVTSIGDYAFNGCSGLTSITIPDSVTSIGNSAFESCRGLTSVDLGNGVTSIGDGAFKSCTGLTNITSPDSVTSIGDYAFSSCSGLTSITIPDSVTSIGNSAFSGCSGLTSVTIPNSVTSIGDSAFYRCTGLTSITIPDSVTSIGNSAFSSCLGLTSVDLGNSVTSIGDYAFYNCKGLTSVDLGNSVTSIGNSAFESCRGLTSVTIPDSVTSIGDYAFQYCYELTSVDFDNGVTSIGNYAFQYCLGLTSVDLGNSVTSIGDYAFYNCTGLTSITIPDSVTSIGNSAFQSCSRLTSVVIGNGVTSIGYGAFNYCTNCEIDCSANAYAEQWCISQGYTKVREHVYKP